MQYRNTYRMFDRLLAPALSFVSVSVQYGCDVRINACDVRLKPGPRERLVDSDISGSIPECNAIKRWQTTMIKLVFSLKNEIYWLATVTTMIALNKEAILVYSEHCFKQFSWCAGSLAGLNLLPCQFHVRTVTRATDSQRLDKWEVIHKAGRTVHVILHAINLRK
jgi:hypothetical protein